MLILEQKLVLYGKTTSAASGKCSRFPIRYNIAKDSAFDPAIRSQIIFQSHFSFSLLPPPNAHGLAVNSLDGLQD